jgi:WD40 repeat protein
VNWQDNPNVTWVNLNADDVKILGSDAQEIAFEPSSEAVNPGENDPTSTAFGFKTADMDSSGQAQLIVNAASEVMMKSSASFTFDPAADGAIDQVWEMNEELNLDGQELRIVKVTRDEIGGNVSLTINMESSGDIISAGVIDQAHPSISGADGRSGDISDGVNTYHKFWVTLNYDGGLPEEPITFTIFSYTIRLEEQSWVIVWTPVPASANIDTAVDQSQAECLSRAAWQESMQSTPSIPDELNGKMLLELTLDDGRLNDQLAVSRLDGSEMRFLAEDSANGAVSPDGTRIIYTNGGGGIYISQLETGSSEPLAGGGSFTGVERLFWSPDGTQIAFSGTDNNAPMNIFLSNLDGSKPRMIEGGESLKLMQGWLPDGRMLYVTMDKNGPVLKLIDPQSGETSVLFNVPQLATPVVVSKDGKRLAINWLEESTGDRLLYIFTADGSQRRTVLKLNGSGDLRGMAWSADGNWLLADLSWDVAGEPYAKALVQADSCRIIPLPDLEGRVIGWLP